MHASHCADMSGALHSHIATTYGLVRDSILNSTRYFHTVEGLVPDIMHDLLEGALQLCTKLLLNHIIVQEKKFSLEDFNSRISCFHYGPSDVRNKPSLISHTVLTSSDNKLCQSGEQDIYIIIYMYSSIIVYCTCTITMFNYMHKCTHSFSNVVPRTSVTTSHWRQDRGG